MKLFSTLCLLILFTSISLFAQDQSYDRHSKERGFLGISSNDISKKKATQLGFDNKYGSYVTRVKENSAADRLGLQPFDYVYAVDGVQTDNDNDLIDLLCKYDPGTLVSVQYVRDGKTLNSTTTLGDYEEGEYKRVAKGDRPFFGITPSHDDKPKGQMGQIVNIISNSSAEAIGMEDGDIITAINNNPIIDWHDVSRAINPMDKGKTITVDFIREGEALQIAGPVGSYAQTYPDHYSSNSDQEEETSEEDEAPTLTKVTPVATSTEEEAPAFDEVIISMEEVTEEEAKDMKEQKGVDMPLINNLQIAELQLFPNPNEGVFNLSFDLPERGLTSVRIFNSAAQLVYESMLTNFTGYFNETIDISNNAKGFYFLEVRQGNKSMVKKVVLQ